jgi:hypothetical protein
MNYDTLSSSHSINWFGELLKRLLIYGPLLQHLKTCNSNFSTRFVMESIRYPMIKVLGSQDSLASILSILSLVLALVTFRFQYTIRTLTVNKRSRLGNIKLGGGVPAVLGLVVNLARYLVLRAMHGNGSKSKADVDNALSLAMASGASLLFSLLWVLKLDSVSTGYIVRLASIWKVLNGLIISYFFIIGVNYHPQQMVSSTYRIVFMVSTVSLLSHLETSAKKIVSLSFINTLAGFKTFYLIILTCTYFYDVKAYSFESHDYLLVPSNTYIEHLIIFIMFCRQHLYHELKLIGDTLMYGTSQAHVLTHALFDRRAKAVVSERSSFLSYFLDKIQRIMNLEFTDLFHSNHSLRNTFLKRLTHESLVIEETVKGYVQSRYGARKEGNNLEHLKMLSKVGDVSHRYIVSEGSLRVADDEPA